MLLPEQWEMIFFERMEDGGEATFSFLQGTEHIAHTQARSSFMPKVQAGHSHPSVGILRNERGMDLGEGGCGCVFFVHALLLFYVVTLITQPATNHTVMHPQQIGYQQKALDESKKPVGPYEHPCMGMTEITRKGRDVVPTLAKYSRFSIYVSEWFLCPGGSYAPATTVGLLATSSRCTSKAQACQVEATSISVVKRVLLVDPKWKL
jgi:hypothetical protein